MSQGDHAKGPEPGKAADDQDEALSARLNSLGAGLRELDARKAPPGRRGDGASDSSGIGQAMRLSTEFIAGIIVGGGAGWGLDRWLGTRPWGMIVLLLLGTCAGFFNVARAAGLLKSRTGDKSSVN